MYKYYIMLQTTAWQSVEVYAEDTEDALEQALDTAGVPTNYVGVPYEVSGEWESAEVENLDTDESENVSLV